jgi:signal peptidase I
MLKRIVQYLTVSVIGLAVVGAVWFTFASPYKLYVVQTGSMGDTIPSKSAVIVRTGEYHAGQVITFRAHNETITHRLVRILPDGTIITKGDANTSADSTRVPVADIIGEVVLSQRDVGWWLIYVTRPGNMVAILLLIFVVRHLWKLDDRPEASAPHRPLIAA